MKGCEKLHHIQAYTCSFFNKHRPSCYISALEPVRHFMLTIKDGFIKIGAGFEKIHNSIRPWLGSSANINRNQQLALRRTFMGAIGIDLVNPTLWFWFIHVGFLLIYPFSLLVEIWISKKFDERQDLTELHEQRGLDECLIIWYDPNYISTDNFCFSSTLVLRYCRILHKVAWFLDWSNFNRMSLFIASIIISWILHRQQVDM